MRWKAGTPVSASGEEGVGSVLFIRVYQRVWRRQTY
jgi:hypothetical protein